MTIPYKTILQSAFLTVRTLFGGLLAGGVAGNLIFESLSGHNVRNPSSHHVALGNLSAVVGVLIGSAAWGWTMGGIAQAQDRWRMVFAGILGFAPITITLAVALLTWKASLLQKQASNFPRTLYSLYSLSRRRS